ncbi:MAG: ribonuclease D, partial [Parvibaculales bacterium]
MKIITDTESLKLLCKEFSKAPYITLDTEFIREKTFFARLCLIQIACPGDEAIIDPLSENIDLNPFYKLLKNSKLMKVMHGSKQDIEIFNQEAGIIPAPLMDTQIMAMVCGFGDSASYEALTRQLANKKIDKTSRFTDWGHRPLSEKQLEYALGDVTYLREIYEKLLEQITHNKRMSWIEEEIATLLDKKSYCQDPKSAWKRLKLRNLKSRQLGVFIELAQWRESCAQSRNIPRNWVLKEEALTELARQAPESLSSLSRCRAVPKSFAQNPKAHNLIAAIKRGVAKKEEDLPKLPSSPDKKPGTAPLTKMLKLFMDQCCE